LGGVAGLGPGVSSLTNDSYLGAAGIPSIGTRRTVDENVNNISVG
jgi:hypothetical protein